jgi:hypothetical protein
MFVVSILSRRLSRVLSLKFHPSLVGLPPDPDPFCIVFLVYIWSIIIDLNIIQALVHIDDIIIYIISEKRGVIGRKFLYTVPIFEKIPSLVPSPN